MSTTLIYYCPEDHHQTTKAWLAWADELRSCLLQYKSDEFQYAPPFRVKINDETVFKYGESTGINAFNNEDSPASGLIEIRYWSSIVFYSAVAIRISNDLDVLEVKRSLTHLQLLNEYRGCVDQKQVKLAVYHHDPLLELRLRQYVHRQGNFVYITGWYPEHQDKDWILGLVPTQHYDVYLINPKDDRYDHSIWRAGMDNRLTVVSLASSFVDAMMLTIHDYKDMQLFLGEWKVKEPVITVGCCHMDDLLICVYNMPDFQVEGCNPMVLI